MPFDDKLHQVLKVVANESSGTIEPGLGRIQVARDDSPQGLKLGLETQDKSGNWVLAASWRLIHQV